ncbi:hypothetical protein RBSH_03206 [Rhodopirellula baltica SH28]|uniref:Uncharacterized protein n=1 Tax=Rhodopirellula baltica SH28 TaxID=993517 RepID=K5CD02_RHOBT|nr:hypothetical protein RBSH_03206 [Rhodopirellula baltica SH28]
MGQQNKSVFRFGRKPIFSITEHEREFAGKAILPTAGKAESATAGRDVL